MDNELKYKWKDIFIWNENNQVQQVETIEQALEQGKAGYYVVCTICSTNKDKKLSFDIIGCGKTLEEVLLDVMDFGLIQHNNEFSFQKILECSTTLPSYFGAELYLFPATDELVHLVECERTLKLYKGDYVSLSECNTSITCTLNLKLSLACIG